MKASEYLDILAVKMGCVHHPMSDYALSKVLNVSAQTVSRYRHNVTHFSDDIAIRVAKIMELDPMVVLADVAAERTTCPAARKVWRRLAKQVGRAAAVLVVVSTANFSPASIDSTVAGERRATNVYYVKLCRIAAVLGRLLRWLSPVPGARCPA